jgi:hypothetical protein
MTDTKTIAVQQLQDVLKSVEKAMKDIQAGNYDEASRILEELKCGYQETRLGERKAG